MGLFEEDADFNRFLAFRVSPFDNKSRLSLSNLLVRLALLLARIDLILLGEFQTKITILINIYNTNKPTINKGTVVSME